MKECSRHLGMERSLGPDNLLPKAEEIRQNIGLPRQIPRLQLDIEGLCPLEKLPGQQVGGVGHRPALPVDVSNYRRVVAHRGHMVTRDHLLEGLKSQE